MRIRRKCHCFSVVLIVQSLFSLSFTPELLAQAASQPVSIPIIGDASETLSLPASQTGRQANQHGFVASVTIGLHDNAGSVPVHIVVDSTTVFSADRELIFRFSTNPSGQVPLTNMLVVDIPIRLPQGDKQVIQTHYIPKWSFGSSQKMQILERPSPGEPGRPLADCAGTFAANRNVPPFNTFMETEYKLNSLFVVETDQVNYARLPDLRPLLAMNRRGSEIDVLGPPRAEPMFWSSILTSKSYENGLAVCGQADLPNDWRGYQNFDLIVLSQAAMLRIKNSNHSSAMRSFVMAGGSILLYDAKSEQDWIESFQLSDLPTKEVVAIQDILSSFLRYSQRRMRAIQNEEMGNVFWGDEGLGNEETLWTRSLGMGYVFGIPARNASAASDSPSNDSFPSKQALRNIDYTLAYRKSPMLRRGVDPVLGDRGFQNWLIPGVAQPPVYTFMGLLGLFVILVGPVAYRSTAKRGRSYLMFLIAPLLAIITTLSMFTYGILADGFSTVARVRQLTWVDSRARDAVQRVQATYFAGLSTNSGLSFPGNAEVLRYPDGADVSLESLSEMAPQQLGTIVLDEESQRLSASFLPSRQQRQFVFHQPLPQLGRLTLRFEQEEVAAKDSNPTLSKLFLHSELPFALERMILRDGQGDYWFAEQVEPAVAASQRNEVKLSRVAATDASTMLSKLYNEFRPLAENTSQSGDRSFRRNNGYRTRDLIETVNSSLNQGSDRFRKVSDGSFETWLNQSLQLDSRLPRLHFVAISTVSDDVVAAKDAEVVDSVRFVFGTVIEQ